MAALKPLSLALIEEGRLAARLDEALEHAQEAIGAYREVHGERSKKGRVEVLLTVIFEIENPTDRTVSIRSRLRLKTSPEPEHVTVGMEEPDADGRNRVWVRPSGSTSDHPKVGRLTTDDGRIVHPETHEPESPTPRPPAKSRAAK